MFDQGVRTIDFWYSMPAVVRQRRYERVRLALLAFKRKSAGSVKPSKLLMTGPLLAFVAAITPLNLTLICGAISKHLHHQISSMLYLIQSMLRFLATTYRLEVLERRVFQG